MEIYFPVKDFDSHNKRYYQLVNFNGKPMTPDYLGGFGLYMLAKDVASKIKDKELGDYLILDMSLGICEGNNAIKRLNPINSLEYEFFNMFVKANLREKNDFLKKIGKKKS